MKNFKKRVAVAWGLCAVAHPVFAAVPVSTNYVNSYYQSVLDQLTNYQSIPNPIYSPGPGVALSNNAVLSVTAPPTTFRIGMFYQGGVIYWLDPRDYPHQHGLIADINDLPGGLMRWFLSSIPVPLNPIYPALSAPYGGENAGTGPSEGNTKKLHSASATNYPPANGCANKGNGWYLPSYFELYTLMHNSEVINTVSKANGGSELVYNSSSSVYWSSTTSAAKTHTYPVSYPNYFVNLINNSTVTNVGRARCIKRF